MNPEEIGNYIRNTRRRKGLSLRELAELTGISYSTINKYENGIIVPKQDKLEAIQAVLGVPQDTPTNKPEPERENIQQSQIDPVEISLSSVQASLLKRYLALNAVRKRANGFCELCGQAAPFKVDDVPFLEFHHVRPYKDGGSWSEDNIVALCPVCNAKVSFAPSEEDQAKLEAVVHKK